jgi:hypothetical protein
MAALSDAIEWTQATGKRAKLHAAQEKACRALDDRRRELDDLYERALAPDSNWREIAQVSAMVGEWGRVATEKLRPQIDELQLKLAAPAGSIPPEVRQVREESIKVAEAWLTLYRELHEKLQRLAAERRPADAILRARPVEGEIDHEALSREFMARFPKLRAALAK